MNARQRFRFTTQLLKDRAHAARTLDLIATSVADDHAERDLFSARREGSAGAFGGSLEDDAAVAAHEAASVDDIDETLWLLKNDPSEYGKCLECGRPISPRRLELVPGSRYCIRHA